MATPLPKATQRILNTIDCPPALLCPAGVGVAEFQKLLLWLEDERIRLLTPKERKGLRNFNEASLWWKEAGNYLKELNIIKSNEAMPEICAALQAPNQSLRRIFILTQLTHLALQDVYLDQVEASKIVLEAPSDDGTLGSSSTLTSASKSTVRQYLNDTNAMLKALDLPILPNNAEVGAVTSALRSILVRIEKPTNVAQTHKPNLNLAVGIAMSDDCVADLQPALVVLRLLHGRALRHLQNKINDTVAKLQEVTADPKTDTRRGVVGR